MCQNGTPDRLPIYTNPILILNYEHMARKRRKKKAKAMLPAPAGRVGKPPTYRPDMALTAAQHLSQGRTVTKLSDILGVTAPTLYKWKKQHLEFRMAMENAAAFVDDKVENAMLKRAVGCDVEKTKIIQNRNTGQAMRVRFKEEVLPDVNAATFWLVNRRPERWKNKQEILTGSSTASPAQLLQEMRELELKTGMYARLGITIETVSAVLEVGQDSHFLRSPDPQPALEHAPLAPASDSEPTPDLP